MPLAPHHPLAWTLASVGLIAGATAATLQPVNPPQPTHAEIAGTSDLEIADASKQLKHTLVAASLTQEHAPDTSLLWCATFQIAWDQFITLGGPLALQGEPPVAAELSSHPFPKNALDDGSFVAMIGEGPGTIDRITAELERKFKGAASPKVLPSKSDIRPGDYVAYSYLFKNLAFDTPFTKTPHGVTFRPGEGRPSMCRAFGLFDNTTDWSKVASQVTVWHYAAADDFVIELRTNGAGDRLIIARLKPGATLKETADAALARTLAEHPEPGLRKEETVLIPVLNFDITRSYGEVCGVPATSPSSIAGFSISSALQNIRFRLDEKGAVLKSDAAIAVRGAAPAKEHRARQFICDGPFLVFMERQGADSPYFAAWIDNPELLVPAK